MAVERYASKTDVVVKLVLVFFISLLSFSIGTFVGKKFSDNQHKLSQFEPGHATEPDAEATDSTVASEENKGHGERSVASIGHDLTEVKPNQALSDDEIAKLAEEFVTDDDGKDKKDAGHLTGHAEAKAEEHGDHSHAAAPAHAEVAANHEHSAAPAHAAAPVAHEAAHAATPAHGAVAAHDAKSESVRKTASVDKKAEPSAAASQVAAGHEPAHGAPAEKADTKTLKTPTSLPKEVAASAVGKYTVQIASYPKEEEAQNMSNDLKTKGFSAFYIPAKIKGDTWYRVSVGLFTTQKEAQAYRNDLMARAKVSSAMVQKIAQ